MTEPTPTPLRDFLVWLRGAPLGTLVNAGFVHDRLMLIADVHEPLTTPNSPTR